MGIKAHIQLVFLAFLLEYLTMKRRHFLQGVSALTLLPGTLPLTAQAQPTPGVASLTGRLARLTGTDTNVVLFRGSNSVTVIDSGPASQARAVAAAIADWAGNLPVSTLFNTHWHADHTGGNEALRAAGAGIHAHENTRLWMSHDFEVEWRGTHHAARSPAALPDHTFYGSGTKDLGGETVQYLYYPRAHTDGDIVLFFPDSNVMVAGGLVTDGTYPICDIASGGWIGELLAANASMLDMIDDNTVLIPDSGAPRTRADLQAQHDMLADLYAKMKTMAQNGLSGQNMLDANVTADYDNQWGDPTEFVLETYMGMALHTSDMGGFI